MNLVSDSLLLTCISLVVPGPFTFRIMLLLVSSMNSTLTCVTPPRDPVPCQRLPFPCALLAPTSSSKHPSNLDQLHWLFLRGIHLDEIVVINCDCKSEVLLRSLQDSVCTSMSHFQVAVWGGTFGKSLLALTVGASQPQVSIFMHRFCLEITLEG